MRRLVLALSLAFFAACSCGDDEPGETPLDPEKGRIRGTLTPFRGASVGDPKALDPRFRGLAEAARKHMAQQRAQRALTLTSAQVQAYEQALIGGEVMVDLEIAATTVERVLERIRLPGVRFTYKAHLGGSTHLLGFSLEGVQAASKAQTFDIVQLVARLPGVRIAEPNRRVRASAIPNDPNYRFQWHYEQMNLPAAWDITTGSSGVVVAVIDNGIVPHPDLDSRVLPGADMISDVTNAGDGNGRDSDPTDEGFDGPQNASSTWHGTHVAGTIGAASNNGTGVAGVNWNARILPVRVLGRTGGNTADLVAAINWAIGDPVAGLPNNANPAKVINMSLGQAGPPSATIQTAIDKGIAKDVVFVVAAGNEDADTVSTSPCNQQNVICVGSVGLSGRRSSFSNYGAEVDVMAPGGEMTEDLDGNGRPDGILSTARNAQNQPAYLFLEGTSMATPHVAGLAALMAAVQPAIDPAIVEDILKNTAITASRCTIGGRQVCGFGLINARAAVARAQGLSTEGPPVLSTTTQSLFFQETRNQAQPTQSLLLTNLGGGTIRATASAVGPQASAMSFPSGNTLTIDANTGAQLPVRVDMRNLADGEYTSTLLRITGDGSSGSVDVALRIRAGVPPEPDAVIVFAYFDEADEADPWKITEETIGVVEAAANYDYQLDLPPSPVGEYYALATIDDDGDEEFFEEGERTGFWRNVDEFEAIPLETGDVREDISFSLIPLVTE